MLCIILIFSMVAPHMVFCTESDDKAFLNVSKLSGASNWMLFVGSLSVALLTVKEEVNKAASAVFMRLQEQAKDLMEETELDDFIKSFKRGSHKLDEKIAGFDAVNGSLFKIIYESISNTLTSVKNTAVNKYFGKGVELFMYLYKRFGVIGAGQTKVTFDVMNATQLERETSTEFGTRIQNTNSELSSPIQESLLVQIYIKGLWDNDLKKYLLREIDHISTVDDAILKTAQHEMQTQVIDGDEFNINANWAGKGRGRGYVSTYSKGKGKGKGKGKLGKGGGRGNGNATCDACNQENHYWRSCFKLFKSLRPDWVTPQQHVEFDRKRSEIMANASSEHRRRYIEYARSINDPLATLEEFRNIDANVAQASNGAVVGQSPSPAQEFPGFVAQVNVDHGTTDKVHNNQNKDPSILELMMLGFGILSLCWKHAKNSTRTSLPHLVNFVLKTFAYIGALVAGISVTAIILGLILHMTPGANAMSTVNLASPSNSTQSLVGSTHQTHFNVPPSIFQSKSECVGQVSESINIEANVSQLSQTESINWDSSAGGILLNTSKPFTEWDDQPLNAVITSCFGQKVHSKGSGWAHIGFKLGKRIVTQRVHAIYVPELPKSLIGATAMLNHYNVSTILSKIYPHILLPCGTKVPLRTENDMLTCDCIVLNGVKNIQPTGVPIASTYATSPTYAFLGQTEVDPKGEAEFKLWTRRLCGLNATAVSKLFENTVGTQCPTIIPQSCKNLAWYASGLAGKLKANSHPSKPTRATKFRDVVSFDFLEWKMNGKKYHTLNFLDHKTTHGRCMTTTSRSNACDLVKRYFSETERFVEGNTSCECQSDCAMEFMSKALQGFCDASKITLVHSPPYQHQSMGSVERFNQTIQRMVTTIMDDSQLPDTYLPYAIQYAEYVYNRIPVQHLGWKTRNEIVTGRKPDLRSHHTFGCKARVLKPAKYRRHKFDTHIWECTNLGWDTYSHGWKVLHNSTGKIFTTPDVVFYEHERPFRTVGGNDGDQRRTEHSTGAAVHGSVSSSAGGTHDATHNITMDVETTDITHLPEGNEDDEHEGEEMYLAAEQNENSASPNMQQLPAGWTSETRNESHLRRPYTIFHGPNGEYAESLRAARRISNAQNVLSAGIPTPSATYLPYTTDDTNSDVSTRRITRASGEPLPAINVITGDTIPTRRQVEGDTEYFVSDANDTVHDNSVDIDALQVDVHSMGGKTSRVQWIHALAAFAATVTPSPYGYTAALFDNTVGKCIDSSGKYFTCIDAFSASFNTFDLSIPEPTDLASAQASPNWDVPRGYKAAVETEMGRWKTMKVYQPVMSIPDRAKSLGLRFVFTIKTNETGCFDKAKVRLVVLGHRAELGEHYLENCATTMKWPSFRTTMAVALHQGAILFKQWDTSTAFLYADLEPNTECYVKVPPELVEFLGETMPFWKIVKAAYGLPSDRAFWWRRAYQPGHPIRGGTRQV